MTLLTQEQLINYFKRINYDGPHSLSEAVLRELIWKHVTTIPFESLSIHIGEDVHVHNIDIIFEKIVTKSRGGWCYEMNGLFYYVLKSLGFNVILQLASVFEDDWLPPSHALLIVRLEEKLFLVDVGFGNVGLVEPIELIPTASNKIMKNGIHYKLATTAQGEYVYNAGFNDRLSPQYRFSLSAESLSLDDLVPHNTFIATHDKSPFTRQVVTKIATVEGFIKLIDNQYTEYRVVGSRMQAERLKIESLEEYVQLLQNKFGIQLAPDTMFISPLPNVDTFLALGSFNPMQIAPQ